LIVGALAVVGLLLVCFSAQSHEDLNVPVEVAANDDGLSGLLSLVISIQRSANANIAASMNSFDSGGETGAIFLGLAIAFLYGAVHAFGPGHGKFLIVSYFLGRESRVFRGFAMAAQIAVVHVIAAVIVVAVADAVLRTGFGIRLADVPGVRAASFLIIVGIGLYMLFRSFQLWKRGSAESGIWGHSHSHGDVGHHTHEHHSHGHHANGQNGQGHHGHNHHHHHHPHEGRLESGLLALAAGMVPCPGAVLVMLYAVANDMILPGIMLVAAMSLGIGISICALGIGAILARRTAMRALERSSGSGMVVLLRNTLNFTGAVFVTLIGLISFVAFLDAPLG